MQTIQQIMLWAADHPGWLLAIGFALAFFEALAVVGIVLPGIFLLFLLGAVVGLDATIFAALSIAVALGAMAGDGVVCRKSGRSPGGGTGSTTARRSSLDAVDKAFSSPASSAR